MSQTASPVQPESDGWIVPPTATTVAPSDPFLGLDGTTVVDFWQFALGDLRMNNARGYLAEFIVTRALGVAAQRVEWAEYDVLFDGIKIEVKSSAYLQSWEQPRLSRITFTGLKGTRYTPRGGYDLAGKQFNADVYVFGVQTAQNHASYNVLDLTQWAFYVVPRAALESRGYESISLPALAELTPSVQLGGLLAAVLAAAPSEAPGDSNI
ncbi:hypothetical protein ACFPJ4_07635 [Lysinimonas soli]|uniref:Uncharacterized protein n=1 Tax=Lysinimonas soli TaxID=1074233 RepID=A0ABW0NQ96_9MICO